MPRLGSRSVFGGFDIAGLEVSSPVTASRVAAEPLRLGRSLPYSRVTVGPSGTVLPSALGTATRDSDSLDLLFAAAADVRKHTVRSLFATRAAGASLRSQGGLLSHRRDSPLAAAAPVPGSLMLASAVAADKTTKDPTHIVMGPAMLAAPRRLKASVSMRALRPPGNDGRESLTRARSLAVESRVEQLRASPAPAELQGRRSESPRSRIEGSVGPPLPKGATPSGTSKGESPLSAVASRGCLLSDAGLSVGEVVRGPAFQSPRCFTILPLSNAPHVFYGEDEHGDFIPGALSIPVVPHLVVSRQGVDGDLAAVAGRNDRSSRTSQAEGPFGTQSPLPVHRMQRPVRSPIAAPSVSCSGAGGVTRIGNRAVTGSPEVIGAAVAASPGQVQRAPRPEPLKRHSNFRRAARSNLQPLAIPSPPSNAPAPAAAVASTNRTPPQSRRGDVSCEAARSWAFIGLRSDVRLAEGSGTQPTADQPSAYRDSRYGSDFGPFKSASVHGGGMPGSSGSRLSAADEIDGLLDLLQHF